MARTSGPDLARRSSFDATTVALARTAATAWSRPGPGAGRAGEAVIGVDAILCDAQLPERLVLGGQILPVSGTARVSDERCGHGGGVRIGSRSRNCLLFVPFV